MELLYGCPDSEVALPDEIGRDRTDLSVAFVDSADLRNRGVFS